MGNIIGDSSGTSNSTSFFVGELTLVGKYSIMGRACGVDAASDNELANYT